MGQDTKRVGRAVGARTRCAPSARKAVSLTNTWRAVAQAELTWCARRAHRVHPQISGVEDALPRRIQCVLDARIADLRSTGQEDARMFPILSVAHALIVRMGRRGRAVALAPWIQHVKIVQHRVTPINSYLRTVQLIVTSFVATVPLVKHPSKDQVGALDQLIQSVVTVLTRVQKGNSSQLNAQALRIPYAVCVLSAHQMSKLLLGVVAPKITHASHAQPVLKTNTHLKSAQLMKTLCVSIVFYAQRVSIDQISVLEIRIVFARNAVFVRKEPNRWRNVVKMEIQFAANAMNAQKVSGYMGSVVSIRIVYVRHAIVRMDNNRQQSVEIHIRVIVANAYRAKRER